MSELDLAFGILDHQLVDVDGRRCGKVDDLELEGGPGETPVVTAILVGAGAWKGRGRLGRLAARIARGDETVRVPWEIVGEIKSGVELTKSARELGLGKGDDQAATWVGKVPGA
jgi:sporulation protein YlmC with PRC-barrel domain